MTTLTDIRPQMHVITSCGTVVGLVDSVEDDLIKLTGSDLDFSGDHHYIPLDWVERVEETVRLSKTWPQVKRDWVLEAVLVEA